MATDFRPAVLITSSSENLRLASKLARQLEPYAQPLLWSELPYQSLITSEALSQLRRYDFVVCLIGGETFVRQTSERSTHRDNTLLELGLFIGSLGPDRVLIVVVDNFLSPLLPSDLAGIRSMRCHDESDHRSLEISAERIALEVRGAMSRVEPKPEQVLSSFSCFISYVHQDKRLVGRLYDDLVGLGIRCWLDRDEIHVGDSLRERIEGGLRSSDKVLAVLSEYSLSSTWFREEMRIAMRFEKERRETIIFPVRADDAIFESNEDFWQDFRDRHIADFQEWFDPRSYKRAFGRLAKDLTLSAATEGGGR
jgi:hypothetical protein